MNQLVNNISYHVQNDVLYDLEDAGLLTLSPGTLDKKIYGTTQVVGNLTIKGFIDFLVANSLLVD